MSDVDMDIRSNEVSNDVVSDNEVSNDVVSDNEDDVIMSSNLLSSIKEQLSKRCLLVNNSQHALLRRDKRIEYSVILRGLNQLNNLNFFSKIFTDTSELNNLGRFQYYDYQIQGIKYEIDIYRSVISQILNHKISPNFVDYLASCSFQYGELNEPIRNEIDKTSYHDISKHARETEQPIPPIGFLLTKKAGLDLEEVKLETLWNWLTYFNDNGRQQIDFDNMFFQIIYSLTVMAEFQLMHNDLHTENILVQELKEPIDLYYVYEDRVYRIYTRFIPFIYDWDYGYIRELGDNPKLEDYCKDLFICNNFDERRDLYVLACSTRYIGPFRYVYDNFLTRELYNFDKHGEQYNKTIPINNITGNKILMFLYYTKLLNHKLFLVTLSNREINELFNMEPDTGDISNIKNLDSITFILYTNRSQETSIPQTSVPQTSVPQTPVPQTPKEEPRLSYDFWNKLKPFEKGYREVPNTEIRLPLNSVGNVPVESDPYIQETYNRYRYNSSITEIDPNPSRFDRTRREGLQRLNEHFHELMNKNSNISFEILIYQGYGCRPTGYGKTIPTPFSCLNSNMFDSLLYNGEIPISEHVYTFPTEDQMRYMLANIGKDDYDNVNDRPINM